MIHKYFDRNNVWLTKMIYEAAYVAIVTSIDAVGLSILYNENIKLKTNVSGAKRRQNKNKCDYSIIQVKQVRIIFPLICLNIGY